MKLTRPRGFQDLIGAEARAANLVEERARVMARRYNLNEIRIPMMERIDLYQRSTGETSDIVSKQMYMVKRSDDGSDSGDSGDMILRPEGTPGVVRAYIEARLDRSHRYQRFFYCGPMLRYERPQKGRYRQFNQFGVEIFGRADAACDAELMIMIDDLMRDLGLEVRFEVNSLGHDRPDCRPRFRAALLEYGRAHFAELCEDCQQRFERNPLRLLDCKIDAERVAQSAPKSLEYLCSECRMHFDTVQQFLSDANVPFVVEPSLVRGLDYYTRTAFEVVSSIVGRSQSALAAGGRYDGLVKELGGESVPGTGFAIGVERTALALQAGNFETEGAADVAIAGIGEPASVVAMNLAHELRGRGLRVEVLPPDKKLKTALTIADRMGAAQAVLIGEDELQKGIVQVRDLKSSSQREIPQTEIASYLAAPSHRFGRGETERSLMSQGLSTAWPHLVEFLRGTTPTTRSAIASFAAPPPRMSVGWPDLFGSIRQRSNRKRSDERPSAETAVSWWSA